MRSVGRADPLRTSYNVQTHIYFTRYGRRCTCGLEPTIHYHFGEKIALAWLNKKELWSIRYLRRSRCTPGTIRNISSTNSLKSSSLLSISLARSSVVTSSNINILPTTKPCNALNKSVLYNGSFDKRLILHDEYKHLSAPETSMYSEWEFHKWTEKRTKNKFLFNYISQKRDEWQKSKIWILVYGLQILSFSNHQLKIVKVFDNTNNPSTFCIKA